ncbi:DUF2575 domain-containing protein [Serratia rubidaea]|nr:DUF2575 domain-containing protein [Serratia rubidaea]UJD87126.1 DUF2575 domain-containing protein [Serratia rubidaea]
MTATRRRAPASAGCSLPDKLRFRRFSRRQSSVWCDYYIQGSNRGLTLTAVQGIIRRFPLF